MDSLYLRLDPSGTVVGSLRSPDPQPGDAVAAQGLALVDHPTFDAGRAKLGACKLVSGALQDYAPAPIAPYGATPYLTGRDVVDGMSPAQAKAADAEDPRNLARISGARLAADVKSCVARVAKANGITADVLLAQAKPTGGA